MPEHVYAVSLVEQCWLALEAAAQPPDSAVLPALLKTPSPNAVCVHTGNQNLCASSSSYLYKLWHMQ